MPKSTGSRYTKEFKAEAVQLARSSPERSIRQLAYELGIADQTLRNWIRQAQIDRGEREGRVGSAYDNALAESFVATLKTELLYRNTWPTRQAVRTAFLQSTSRASTTPEVGTLL